ncbi:MAG: 30S ribosomal protein S17e [Nitrososphaerota archaeon]|nr:30S ribosomal protein S17e [Nitrososphaerota archaeon]MDG6975222.1 30S ribosomal protein S17e [Nitrososphaerota archaeon]MDG7009625.1 30S ribosomal protein S17e [Nitrososphaerota archaeon]MDG7027670.1 30S ribosomal protein S17e [Nitrososphaerota archaeon]
MQRHPEAFGTDFETNKKALEEMAVIPSKQLRNRIAGYITKTRQVDAEDSEEPAVEESKE